jgi:hypothetical protein
VFPLLFIINRSSLPQALSSYVWHHRRKNNTVANKVTEMSPLAVKQGLFSDNEIKKSKKCSICNRLILPYKV